MYTYNVINESNEKYLSQLINSQQNLKKNLFGRDGISLHRHSLLSLKNSNCSNSLKTIIFYNTDFNNVVLLNEVFEQLNVLESIHILYCKYIFDFIQQIIHVTKPLKLKSLLLRDFH